MQIFDTGLSKPICPTPLSVFSSCISNYPPSWAKLQIYHITWFCDAATKVLAHVSCSKRALKEIGVTFLNILMLSSNTTVLSMHKMRVDLPNLLCIYFTKMIQKFHVDF